MKWKRARQSRNVDDRRGQRGRRVAAGGGLGLGGIAIVVVISMLLGQNPMEILGLVNQVESERQTSSAAPAGQDDESRRFVAAILGETEDVWSAIFSRRGQSYAKPTLVLFSGQVRTACGSQSSATGPFYCPADEQVYIDLSFFEEMKRRFGGGGDFAYAYVIAHEVGHHVQHLTGSANAVRRARSAGRDVDGDNGLLVRQELQADCFAAISRKRWRPPMPSATTACSNRRAVLWYRTRSPTVPRRSACAGSSAASNPATPTNATLSAPAASDLALQFAPLNGSG